MCGSVWNFSGIKDAGMNPYNFYNGGHCWIFVGDKMLGTFHIATLAPGCWIFTEVRRELHPAFWCKASSEAGNSVREHFTHS